MTDAKRVEWAEVQDGKLKVSEGTLQLPDIRLNRELGRGANAVVFEAFDTNLSRKVAVKVWNSRGQQRAHAETKKIANFQHPLIVKTHSIQWIEGFPFAVMELVVGESAKKWLATNPPIEDRVRVWKLYSRGLRYIHDQKAVHGDPHTGNILVYRDVTGHFHDGELKSDAPIGIKIADAGTSEFLSSPDILWKREPILIWETAKRLFHDQDIDNLWSHPSGLTHQATLMVLDALADFITFTTGFLDYDRAAENAEILVRDVLKTPLFHLDGVVNNVKKHGITSVSRFANRLNRDLLGIHDWVGGDGVVGKAGRDKYALARARYLEKIDIVK